jgi:DNA polymerase-3 subunit delta'
MKLTNFFPWHRSQWQILRQYFDQQRIPHALLIQGGKGLGKQHLAYAFAKALVCPHRLLTGHSCGTCSSCKLVDANTHPDLITLKPKEEGKDIGIDLIRELMITLRLKPQFEMSRVVIIQAADRLNTAAANAFLKCLEEPNERTCLILLADKPSKLPATILSRCQTILVQKPTKTEAYTWLNTQEITKNCETLLTLAQGAPLLAQSYFKMEVLTLRKSCFDDWIALSNAQENPIQIAERWAKHPMMTVMNWLISWVVDLIKCRHQMQKIELYNPDFQDYFYKLSPQLTVKNLFTYYEYLLQHRQNQGTQVNVQLMFEELFILWSQLIDRN